MLDISPEPLLMHLGKEKPFSVTFPATQLAAIGAVVLGAVVLVSALLARRVIRPIDSLIAASREVSAGNLSAKVSIPGIDELSELGGNFNRMVDSLNSAEHQRRRLIADSAHELRTPLSNINGYLEAISDGVLDASPEHIESLREESTLLARIVDDLRLLALSDAGQLPHDPVTTDVRQFLRGCRVAHQAAADRAGVTLDTEVPGPLPVEVDPARMRQAIGNLVSNAVRHTPEGGTITLRAFETGPTVVIEVVDTGEGLPAGESDKLFERFWRADPARHRSTGGSGLGLAITREIVTAHGGTITARDWARGAVFAIALPRVRTPADRNDAPLWSYRSRENAVRGTVAAAEYVSPGR